MKCDGRSDTTASDFFLTAPSVNDILAGLSLEARKRKLSKAKKANYDGGQSCLRNARAGKEQGCKHLTHTWCSQIYLQITPHKPLSC